MDNFVYQILFILQEEFEDNNGEVRICKSGKDRHHNGKKTKNKKQDKQRFTKHTPKTKDRVTRTQLRMVMNSCTKPNTV